MCANVITCMYDCCGESLVYMLESMLCMYVCIYGWCAIGPKEAIGHYHETIGEALQGVELEFSGLDISFKG